MPDAVKQAMELLAGIEKLKKEYPEISHSKIVIVTKEQMEKLKKDGNWNPKTMTTYKKIK